MNVEEMEGPTSSWGSRNRIICLIFQEHDDDDDDDDDEIQGPAAKSDDS